jgi:hypothetical protein
MAELVIARRRPRRRARATAAPGSRRRAPATHPHRRRAAADVEAGPVDTSTTGPSLSSTNCAITSSPLVLAALADRQLVDADHHRHRADQQALAAQRRSSAASAAALGARATSTASAGRLRRQRDRGAAPGERRALDEQRGGRAGGHRLGDRGQRRGLGGVVDRVGGAVSRTQSGSIRGAPARCATSSRAGASVHALVTRSPWPISSSPARTSG